jgi:peptidoglycan/xylan/chitin deacetylase (PgdA/CDA1 family)
LRQAFRTEPARTTMIATNARPLLAPFESFRNVRFGSKADICGATNHVRLPPKADMCGALAYVGAQRCALTLSVPSSEIRSGFPYKDCVNRCGIKRVLRFIVTLFVCILAGVSVSASAETCSGNPDALGTSRVLTINPGEFSLIGTMQYKQTLALGDREVVLTFDDGPLLPYTEIILDTLASQCVKATYFLVGQMASAYPSVVRRIYNEGHTIGTHSQHHPHFERLSMRRVEREVDSGISSVTAALGDAKALSPFFRIPYLGRTKAIERFLEGKQLVTWSVDVDTDDWWRGSSPKAIVQRAMRRLNAKGRGIILMHDIHRNTAMALPILLRELKANGYNVVHVVAAGERPKLIPELIALPTSDGKASPTALTNAPSGDDARTARRNHRVKKRSVGRHHPVHSWSQADQVTTTQRPFWVIGGH